jgi:DNA-binding winged helix-turn-helix (wHTH) protein
VRLQVEDIILDSGTRQVWCGGRAVRLSPKAFDLLALLVERRPRAVSKAEIHDRLWFGTFVSDSSLPSLVSEVREAIADHDRTPRLLRTLYGIGYAIQTAEDAVPSSPGERPAAPVCWLVGDASEIPLPGGDHVLGREGTGVILLKSSTVSRRHARLSVGADRTVLEDLGSKNGTWVNDRRIEGPTPVVDGDRVRIGSLHFTLRRSQPAESTELLP